jgi:hypothetical protein
MQRMLPPPVMVRGKRKHPRDIPNDVVSEPRFAEGTVATIVENDEDTHEHRTGHDSNRQREPQGNGGQPEHQDPKRCV